MATQTKAALEAQIEGLHADFAAVQTVLEDVLDASDVDGAILTALGALRSAFGWDYASFWKREGDVLVFALESGEVSDDFRRVTRSSSFAHGVGLSGRTWARGALVFVEDLADVSDCVRAPSAREAGVKSGLCIPIYRGDAFVGTMDFFATRTITLSESRADAHRCVGRVLRTTLERVHELVATEQERACVSANAQAVSDALEATANASDEEGATLAVLGAVVGALGLPSALLWRRSGDGMSVEPVEAAGRAAAAARSAGSTAPLHDNTHAVVNAWNSCAVSWSHWARQNPSRAARSGGGTQAVCVPISVCGESVSVLEFHFASAGPVREDQVAALRNVGQLLSTTVERFRDSTRVQEMAAAQWDEAERLGERVAAVTRAVDGVVAGDLTVTIEGADEWHDDVGSIAKALGQLVDEWRASMTEIAASAADLRASSRALGDVSTDMQDRSNRTSEQATSAAAGAEQVASSMDTVSTGMDALSLSIEEISRSASEAARVAEDAARKADSTNDLIGNLGESSSEIGAVIKLITSIAQQTNLLALNATIEAARAGQAGKGFAVVANEVKELAKETASAAEDIERRVATIQRDVGTAVNAMADIRDVIVSINDIQSNIACAVEEQTATAQDISASVAQAAQSGAAITSNISEVATNARSTEEGANASLSAAGTLSAMATSLTSLVERFRLA